jgi:hypothetical protein
MKEMLPDHFCDKCIWNYVPKGTALADLEENFGTCDHCGKEGKLYGLLYYKTLSDWVSVELKVYVSCVRCGKRLKVLKDQATEDGLKVVVERHICEEQVIKP